MKTNVALIGFMGTGKTVVGRLLAGATGKDFLELDTVIAEEAGMSIPDIFAREGEAGFRHRETTAVAGAANRKNTVIACGGGVVLTTMNINRLRETSRIVLLTAARNVILERTRREGATRPLLAGPDPAAAIARLLEERRPLYHRAADVTVSTTRRTPEEVVREIRRKLQI
jgi:shikimate kinase